MKKDEQIANKIIKELQEYGFTPDEMLEVIRLAREKYNELKKNEKTK